jgi:UDP-glucose 4-epimerase
MYLSSFSDLYGMSAVSMRMANIIGPRLTHGVIYDFYFKLKKDSTRLEVLGTGRQQKEYMFVTDTVEAAAIFGREMKQGFQPVNVSSGERLTVTRIAELVCRGLNLPDAKIEYTGTERGWAGDVLKYGLDIELLKSFGWQPVVRLEDGIARYVDWLVETYGPIK